MFIGNSTDKILNRYDASVVCAYCPLNCDNQVLCWMCCQKLWQTAEATPLKRASLDSYVRTCVYMCASVTLSPNVQYTKK